MSSDRYDGKPFLRFLDCFVLKAIGHLDAGTEETLRQMESKLSEVFGKQGRWDELVAHQMDFPDTLPAEIARIWTDGSERARAMDLTVDPHEFARQFVDTNFPHE